MIAVITDFGEFYTGVVKGVLSEYTKDFTVVTSSITPRSIMEAAYVLFNSVPFFPPKTIFLTVVDPGVGTERGAVAVEFKKFWYVGPDNGTLTYVLERYTFSGVYSIDLEPESRTFHGRDLFAPTAGRLSRGDRSMLKPYGKVLKRFKPPAGVVYIDRFGNLALNLPMPKTKNTIVTTPRGSLSARVIKTFGELGKGEAGIVKNSFGFTEIVVRGGSAKEITGLKIGDEVSIKDKV